MQNCVKKGGSSPTWCSQPQAVAQSTVRPVPHTPVHSGCSPRRVLVAQELDGLAVLPGDGTQTSPAPKFVPAMFSQPLAEFLGVVLVAWHDSARCQDSQFVLHQVEERDGVTKMVHGQHVVLVGDLRVLNETADNTDCLSEEGPLAVLDLANVDISASRM